jgi:hypothetical protein
MSSSFVSKLIRPPAVGAWTFALVPREVATKAGFRARLRVKGTIDGVPFKSSLMPRGGGEVFVVVNSEVRDRIGKAEGDAVRFDLELDTQPVVVQVPSDLRRGLQSKPGARSFFETLTPSQRLAYIHWIEEAKQAATRERRVKIAVDKLARREKFN